MSQYLRIWQALTVKWQLIVINFEDDEDDEDELVVWLTSEKCLALFPSGTIARDPHYRESPTRHEQGLNLRRT